MSRLRDWLTATLLAGGLIAVILILPKETVEGRVAVIDGDSLKLGESEIRLYGIDAPEARQTCKTAEGRKWKCGAEAERLLKQLTSRGPVRCVGEDTDRYGRLVARCYDGETDINALMVSRGLALAYPEHSGPYRQEEASAKQAGHGIWAGDFKPPWQWREKHGRGRR